MKRAPTERFAMSLIGVLGLPSGAVPPSLRSIADELTQVRARAGYLSSFPIAVFYLRFSLKPELVVAA
jgi:hypothetical protein